MELRRLGRSDLKIAPLMLGTNVFGWTADEKTSFSILDAFVDAGFNAVDTADVYSRWSPAGAGASETVIGNWLAQGGRRDKIVLATKVGMEMGEGMKGLSAAYIEQAVEASLKRLKTDYIDLYQTHWPDRHVPIEAQLEAFDRLIEMLARDPDAGVRAATTASLENSDRIAAVNALIEALNDPSPAVVVEVIDALEFAGDASIVPQLRPLLEHHDPRVRDIAAEAIAFLEDPDDEP